MKLWLSIVGLMLLTAASALAQVSVEVVLDQEQFLPNEAVPVAVHITNRSGRTLHLGVDPIWLTFDVESANSFVVLKNAEVPVQGEFDLESSQMATKHVDLQPYFVMSRPGRYNVTATLHLKDWGQDIASSPKSFDVIHGARLWSQDFGLPARAGATNGAPELRRYALEEANYLRSQLRLYVQVSDVSEGQVFKVAAIGPMVSFSEPEAQLDRSNDLHVLYQSGGQTFTYSVVNPDGDIIQHDTYDYIKSRPRLSVNEMGDVVVTGGVRRPKPSELPLVMPPNQALPPGP
jgi:hypothetical protein